MIFFGVFVNIPTDFVSSTAQYSTPVLNDLQIFLLFAFGVVFALVSIIVIMRLLHK